MLSGQSHIISGCWQSAARQRPEPPLGPAAPHKEHYFLLARGCPHSFPHSCLPYALSLRPSVVVFFPPCLLLTVRTVSVCNCGLSRRLPDSEYSSLKSSHLSVFAFFFRSAFFPGISPPASPRGSPLWITIQFSPNYLVVFRWL